jgi:hypothetical protein
MSSADILFNNDVEELLVLTSPAYRPRKSNSICEHITSSRRPKPQGKDNPVKVNKPCHQRLYFYGNRESKHSKALLNALYSRDTEYMRTLLKDGVNPNLSLMNYETMCAMTALHVALEMANMDMVNVLIKNGADLNALDGDGRMPIDIACKANDQRFVKFLVDCGCSVQKGETRIVCLGMAFYHLIHGPARGDALRPDALRPTIRELLDTGLIRGWNGINDSVAYVNHVYHRDKQVFGLLFQAAHDVRDVGFVSSSQEVLRRRKDHETKAFLVLHGYLEIQTAMSSLSQGDTGNKLFSVSSLQGICRVSVRRHLRTFPGKISSRIHQLEIPKPLKEYIDFLDLPFHQS